MKRLIIQSILTLTIVLLFSFCMSAQNKEPLRSSEEKGVIFEDMPVEEPVNKLGIERERKAKLKLERREIINEAWSQNHLDLIEPYLSDAILKEKQNLKIKMAELLKINKNQKLGTMIKSSRNGERYDTGFWDKQTGKRLSIRHYCREKGKSFEIYHFIIYHSNERGSEQRYEFPVLNQEIHRLNQDIGHRRFSSPEELENWSKEGLIKLEQAIKDEVTAGYDIRAFIWGLLESYVRQDRPTQDLIQQTFFQESNQIEEIRSQFILISYAEKDDWAGLKDYVSEMTEYQKDNHKRTYIKEFYRDPNEYNNIKEPYGKIMEMLGREK